MDSLYRRHPVGSLLVWILDEGSSEIEPFAILKGPGVALVPNRGDHFFDNFRR